MKTRFSRVMAIALIVAMALTLAACGSANTAASSGTPATDAAPAQLSELLMSTSSSTSSYYIVGQGIADLVNNSNCGFTVSATTSGGTEENINRIANGEAELGIGMPDSVAAAAAGTGNYEGSPVKVASLCGLWMNHLNIIVRKDSGITDISQLKGKRIATNPLGAAAMNMPETLFPLLGLSIDDCEWSHASVSDNCSKLKDGQVDAIIQTLGAPSSAVVDLASTTEIAWLPLPMDVIEKMHEQVNFYDHCVLPAGTYNGQDEDVDCIGFVVNVYASTERVSEEQGYAILNAMFAEDGLLGKYHNAGKNCALANAMNGLATDMHPGAVKFFTEKGMLG